MPDYVIHKISKTLNLIQKSVKSSKILVLGLAYKKNVDDVRESPSMEIINKLSSMDANIYFNDPFFKKFPQTRKLNLNVPCVDISKKTLNDMDLVLLSTDHDKFDYELILKEENIIIDTRGRYNFFDEKIVKA